MGKTSSRVAEKEDAIAAEQSDRALVNGAVAQPLPRSTIPARLG